MSKYTPQIRQQVQSGKVYVEPVANVPTMAHVTFEEPFVAIPQVVASANTTVPGTTVLEVGVANVTKEGFDVYVTRTNTTTTSVSFVAALTNSVDINFTLQDNGNHTDGANQRIITKILKHHASLYPEMTIDADADKHFVDVEVEWTLRDPKGAMIRSGFQAFEKDGLYYYKTPELSIDFTGMAIGDYRLTYESHVPGLGAQKHHAIIRINSLGNVEGSYIEPYEAD
jgi:hypothetical protein